jgi:carbon monoxide dehydrogenase subunit G
MRVQKSIDIAAPPEKIWPFLVEPEKILAWFTTLQSFEYTSEKHNGVGTRFSWEEKAHGSPIRLRFTITEWIENERLAFGNSSGNTVNSYGLHWTLATTPRGSRFTFDEELELPFGLVARIYGAPARCREKYDIGKRLAKLKRLAETP